MPVVLTDSNLANKTCVLWDNFGGRPLVVITDTGSLPGYDARNIVEEATYNAWATNTPLGWIDFDLLVNRNVNSFAISRHNLATVGATVSLRGSNTGLTGDFTVIVSQAPISNDDIFFIFPNVNNRYFRLHVEGGLAVISNASFGQVLQFPCTPINGYRPTHHSRKFKKYFNNSIDGHLLGNRVMASGGTTTVEFPEIPRSFVDGPLLGFEDHYNRGRTFFYAGWPGGKPQDMAYAWADGEESMIDVTYTNGEKLATVGFGMSMKYGR